ncbi:MAG: SH3 domain-containing protein [Anaerolineales bacterium]|nr:SH3 domain-containing protein [Anaerolineales bacterium]
MPGDLPQSLTVGAFDPRTNKMAWYSGRYNSLQYYAVNEEVDYSADEIVKPDIVTYGEILLPSGREFFGTSAATPTIAGAAAIIAGWELMDNDFDARTISHWLKTRHIECLADGAMGRTLGNLALVEPSALSIAEEVVCGQYAWPLDLARDLVTDFQLPELVDALNTAERREEEVRSISLARSAQQAIAENKLEFALALAVAANDIPNPPAEAQVVLSQIAYIPGVAFLSEDYSNGLFWERFLFLYSQRDEALIIWDFENGHQLDRIPSSSGEYSINDNVILTWTPEQLILNDRGANTTLQADVSVQYGLSNKVPEIESPNHLITASSMASVPECFAEEHDRLLLTNTVDDSNIYYDLYWDGDGQVVIKGFQFSLDSRYLITTGYHTGPPCTQRIWTGDEIRLWDVGALRWNMSNIKNEALIGNFSEGEYQIVSTETMNTLLLLGDQSIGIWDYTRTTLEETRFFPIDYRDELFSGDYSKRIVLSPDGKYLAVAQFSQIMLYDASTGELIRDFKQGEDPVFGDYAHHDQIDAIRFSPDGTTLLSASVKDLHADSLILWDVTSGQPITMFQDAPSSGEISSGGGGVIAVSEDFEYVFMDAKSGADPTILSISTGTRLVDLNRGAGDGLAVFSPDNSFLFLTSEGGLGLLADVDTGQVRQFIGNFSNASQIVFSPDSQYLLVNLGTGLGIWDVRSGEQIRQFGNHKITLIDDFSPDGKMVTLFAHDANGDFVRLQAELHLTSDELLNWVTENRYIRELDCAELTLYFSDSFCDDNTQTIPGSSPELALHTLALENTSHQSTGTAQPTDNLCPAGFTPKMIIGVTGRITSSTDGSLRFEPSMSSNQIASLFAGDEFWVLEGPVCSDGYVWWQINYHDQVGWAIEGEMEDYWLEPIVEAEIGNTGNATAVPSPTSSVLCNNRTMRFTAGQRVIVSQMGDGLRLLTEPNGSGEALALGMPGDLLEIQGGPVCVYLGAYHQDTWYWYVYSHADNISGWVSEGPTTEQWICPVDELDCLPNIDSTDYATPSQFTCYNAPPSRLVGQQTARVTPGASNNIRNEPEGQTVLGQIPGGTTFSIIGGPICGQGTGLIWWQVNYGDIIGWTAEGNGGVYWLEPVSLSSSTAGCQNTDLPARLAVGDQARVTTDPFLPNRLRANPGYSAQQIGQIQPGEIFDVIGGLQCKDGVNWWHVRLNSGATGWTAEGDDSVYWLEK